MASLRLMCKRSIFLKQPSILKSFSKTLFRKASVNAESLQVPQQVNKDAAEELMSMPPEIDNPLNHHDFFDVRRLVNVKDLFDARVHFGHTMGTLNEHMKQFILGERCGTLIFDLDQTLKLLQDALNFAAHIAFRDGIIIFIARYKQHTYIVEKTAIECKEFCHSRPWEKGLFTDPDRYGMMTRLPDLAIFLNTLGPIYEIHDAIIETNKLLIPSIGIVDSNCFPNYITYPVPGNDDSPEAVELYCKLFKLAILKGKSKRQEYIEKYGNAYHAIITKRKGER